MINKVILLGRLGRDPEMRTTGSGTSVVNFSVATNRGWTKDGERHEETEWHNVIAWSRLAEICNQYLRKGRQVYIEGRLQTREYQDRDGNTRRKTEIVAEEMKMLGGPSDGQAPGGQRTERTERTEQRPAPSNTMEVGITDDDIPF